MVEEKKKIRRGKWRIRRMRYSKNTRMIVKRRKESFKKNIKVDVDNCLNANVYFPPEDGVGGYSRTLVSTAWSTSQLTLSK
jgi:hypothetical protein